MTTENHDPQQPTEDQPPPKQYADQPSRPSGERGTDERKPKVPNQVETSEGDDENSTATEQNADHRRASTRTEDEFGDSGDSESEDKSRP